MPPLRVFLLGRKRGARLAAEILLQRGHKLAAVGYPAADDPNSHELVEFAKHLGVVTVSHYELETWSVSSAKRSDLGEPDLVISYLYSKKIPLSVIDLPRIGSFNFHPAPLPDLRGLGGYNFAILEGMREYGVSVHWLSREIDVGDIVEVRRFPIDPETETALTLEHRSQRAMLQLFRDFVEMVEQGRVIPSLPQGKGRYINRRQMEEAKRVLPTDPPELVERKARAFWFPPYRGAFIEIGGVPFTVVTDQILKDIAELTHRESQEAG